MRHLAGEDISDGLAALDKKIKEQILVQRERDDLDAMTVERKLSRWAIDKNTSLPIQYITAYDLNCGEYLLRTYFRLQ